jgi:hypothetical protein
VSESLRLNVWELLNCGLPEHFLKKKMNCRRNEKMNCRRNEKMNCRRNEKMNCRRNEKL